MTTRLPHFSRSLRFGSWKRADSSRKSSRLRSGGSSRSLLTNFVLSIAASRLSRPRYRSAGLPSRSFRRRPVFLDDDESGDECHATPTDCRRSRTINWNDRLEPPRVYYRREINELPNTKRWQNPRRSSSRCIRCVLRLSWRSPTGGYRRYQMFDVEVFGESRKAFYRAGEWSLSRGIQTAGVLRRKFLYCVLFREFE